MKCEICGQEMVHQAPSFRDFSFVCPNAKDHTTAALEQSNREKDAKIADLLAPCDCTDNTVCDKCQLAKRRLAIAETQLSAALAQVVELREALERHGDHSPDCATEDIDGSAYECDCGFDVALSDTSVTAHQFVQRIEREALEKAIGKMKAIVQAIPINDFSVSKGDSAYNWGRYFVDQFSAAILGEKGGDDGSV